MELRMLGMLACLLLAACMPDVRVRPPQIVDTWKPPQGTPPDPPLSREQPRAVFAYDTPAPVDIQEERVHGAEE